MSEPTRKVLETHMHLVPPVGSGKSKLVEETRRNLLAYRRLENAPRRKELSNRKLGGQS